MNQRGSLDTVLSELLNEAHIWANEGTESMTRSITHGRGQARDNTDTVMDVCLEQIARAISTHVTDILIKRLGLDEGRAQIKKGKKSRKRIKSEKLRRKHTPERQLTTSQSLPCAAPSPPRFPIKCSSIPPSGQESDLAAQYAQPLKRTRDELQNYVLVHHHIENRLNRMEPPLDLNETPLENRASRLRRASTDRKLAAQDHHHGRRPRANETSRKYAVTRTTREDEQSKYPSRTLQ